MLIDKDGAPVETKKIANEDLKLQLLQLTKDILQQKSVMRWETHKMCEDVTIDNLITEAKKLYMFVKETNN